MESNNLRRFRRQQNFTVRELSIAAHVSTATIVAVELYGDFPSTKTRGKIARTLNMSELAIWPQLWPTLEVESVK
jgi:DNA-binding XRE family transcriptional regulator